VTHRYTLLVGGTILPGGGQPSCSAIAWAEGIVLALGTDAQVRSASRGDSDFLELHGAFVVPLGAEDDPRWPPAGSLEIGGLADLAILNRDPRSSSVQTASVVALVRGGHAVRGSLPSR